MIALAANLIGVVVIILASGNEILQKVLNVAHPSVAEFISTSLRFYWDLIFGTIKSSPVPVLVLMGLCIAIGFVSFDKLDDQPRKTIFKKHVLPILVTPVGLFIIILSIMAPPVYFQTAFPADRTVSGGIFLLALSIGCSGLMIGNVLKILSKESKHILQNSLIICSLLVIFLVGIYPIRAAIRNVPSVQATIQYGKAWDVHHAFIRNAVSQNQMSLVVPSIDSLAGLKDVDQDSADWVNKCIADYYGLSSIRIEP